MNSFDIYVNKGPQAQAARSADQAEQAAIMRGAITIEEGLRDETIADALDDYEALGTSGWEGRDETIEAASGQVADEIKRRIDKVGRGYPFALSGNSLSYTPSDTLVYELCLAVTMIENKQGGDFRRLERAFERLTCRAVECFLGNASSYRTGWSGADGEDRPVLFKAVCTEVYEQIGTGEFCWSPAKDHPENPDTKFVKDLGIDSVVWKVLGDGRSGNLILLGQCACGGNWRKKADDIKVEDLKTYWFRPLSAATVLRFFSIPVHIPNNADFSHTNTNFGLAFDRARLVRIAEGSAAARRFMTATRQDDYAELISLVFADPEAAQPTPSQQRRRGEAGRRSQ